MRWIMALVMIAIAGVNAALSLAVPGSWGPAITGIPPGGFATIFVESPRHGEVLRGPSAEIRIRSDKPRTTLVVKLDGDYVEYTGRLVKAPQAAAARPQWEFFESPVFEVVVSGLAPGVHHLEIRSGSIGSSLPIVNEQDVWFVVSQ